MEKEWKDKLEHAVWAARSLFDRGKTSGSSANLSFRHGDSIYITGSGTCFGTLTEESFSRITMQGQHLDGIRPSKEYPLHLMCYEKSPDIHAVIHTHSFYAALYSCVCNTSRNVDFQCQYTESAVPAYTPYLQMKVGTVGLVPYAKPGSEELFGLFRNTVQDSDAYLLANHGPIVPGRSIMDAFYGLEELEESCHIAWELENRSDCR